MPRPILLKKQLKKNKSLKEIVNDIVYNANIIRTGAEQVKVLDSMYSAIAKNQKKLETELGILLKAKTKADLPIEIQKILTKYKWDLDWYRNLRKTQVEKRLNELAFIKNKRTIIAKRIPRRPARRIIKKPISKAR